MKNDYLFFDDFITTFINNELIKEIKKGHCNICIADPRLCNNSIFIRTMKVLEEYIEKSNILLILFENDKNKCLNRQEKRKNKNVIKTIEFLTTIYDYDNYKNYNCKFLKI